MLMRIEEKGVLTGVSAHTPRSTSSGEEHDCITHNLDVMQQRSPLLVRQLGLGRIERDPGVSGPQQVLAYCVFSYSLLELLEVDGERAVCARHGRR